MNYLLWAVFGGFILHFLLTNFLTVLLRPRYEKGVDTAADLINRNISIVSYNEHWKKLFAKSINPVYKKISQRFLIAKDQSEYLQMASNVVSDRSNGTTATIGHLPHTLNTSKEEYRKWYRSERILGLLSPYVGHLANTKWPLQKVFK